MIPAGFFITGAEAEVSIENAWHGNQSIKVTSSSTTWSVSTRTLVSTASPGENNVVSSYIYRPIGGITTTAYASLTYLDVNGTVIATQTGSTTTLIEGDWTRVYSTLQAPAGTAYVYMDVGSSDSHIGDHFYTDGFQIETGTTPSDWVEPATDGTYPFEDIWADDAPPGLSARNLNALEEKVYSCQVHNRGYSLMVAASNARQSTKDRADYTCDGTADQDTINTALAALPAVGGTLVLSEGTFNFSDHVHLVSHCNIIGQGASTILKLIPNVGLKGVLSGSTVHDIYLGHMRISGNKENQSSQTNPLVTFAVSSNIWLDSLVVVNAKGTQGIQVGGASSYDDIKITNCMAFGNGSTGIELGATYGATVNGCIVRDNTGVGIILNTASYCTVKNCVGSGNMAGVHLISCSYCTVEDSIFAVHTTSAGSSSGVLISASSNCNISGCSGYANFYGVWIKDDGSRYVNVIGNCFGANTGTGLSVNSEHTTPCRGTNISYNTIFGGNGYGLFVQGKPTDNEDLQGLVVKGNLVANNLWDGIWLSYANYTSLIGNMAVGNGAWANNIYSNIISYQTSYALVYGNKASAGTNNNKAAYGLFVGDADNTATAVLMLDAINGGLSKGYHNIGTNTYGNTGRYSP